MQKRRPDHLEVFVSLTIGVLAIGAAIYFALHRPKSQLERLEEAYLRHNEQERRAAIDPVYAEALAKELEAEHQRAVEKKRKEIREGK